ncbi:M28 family metallopeptidase [Nocardioides sp. R-C-SC26]|uniref:M28 family metallopeptidase n=1 Tax=Nocardioides sp. R-C-SC26 TaxID=2870414 RepID=UPI001E33502B|nr:M28 family peptidase [Nocardioides sp. R-C-SC26]
MTMMTRTTFLAGVAAAAVAGTGMAAVPASGAGTDPLSPARLHRHVREVCAFGPRWTGYPAERRASHWVAARLRAAGLRTEVDRYGFRKWQLSRWRVDLRADGGLQPIATFPLWSSHGGEGEAPLVDVGFGSDPELALHDLRGKAVVVTGKALLNVFSTYRDVYAHAAARGAVAMFVTSDAPDNLIRPTSSSANQLDKNPIPAFNLGATDLARLRRAARAGSRIRWRLDARHVDGHTHDVTAVLPGSGAESGALMIAAHVDSWFTGALDNATGTAGLIGLAEHFARVPRAKRPKDMYFVSVTGHDTGFPFGGLQHWVRTHSRLMSRLDAFVNLDHLAAHHEEHLSTGGIIDMLGLSIQTPLDQERALFTTAHPTLAAIWTPALLRHRLAPVVPGPTIPAFTPNPDLEGIMGDHGVPSSSLTMATPHYHTIEDTPDRIPPEQLSRAVRCHADVLAGMQSVPGSLLRLGV